MAEITVKWSGKEYKISCMKDDSKVIDLKNEIKNETGVLPDRQKLLGLKFKGNFTCILIYRSLFL